LDDIESWSKDSSMSPVYWLNGLAGTGKSTIAQTISERIFADGRLGGSFFCSRDFKDRRNLHYIFPTLAFQLAHKYPEFRSILVPLLRSNPDIGHESLFNQMKMMIAEPLSSSDISTVIVIDALDECADEEPQSAILSVMGRLVEGIPNIKFFITGRPEPRIQSGFRLGLLRPMTDVFVLHEVEPSIINTDIRLFLERGLSELAKRRGVERDDWPTDEHLNLLCERAGGLFVYAVATLKFLDHAFTSPSEQLDIIATAPGSTTREGKAKLRSSTTLDSLYLSSFQNAFDGMDAEDDEKVRFVIGTVVLAVNPLPPSAIATLVGLGKQQVMDLLRLVQSLLKLPEDLDSPVLPFHKSFPDFITDPLRCINKRFCVSPGDGHLKLALSCLKLMNRSLKQNLLSLPDYALNSEVEDLQARIERRVGVALQYACKSWYSHLIEAKGDIATVVSTLRSFLQERFLGWLEVLSVTGAARDAVVALEKLMPWLQEVCLDPHAPRTILMHIRYQVVGDRQLLHTARDYFHFVTTFFELINVSATHVYHSALELSPLSSVVRKLYYHQRPHPSPRVVIGLSGSWDPSTAAATTHSYYLSSTWSPCTRFVAVVAEEAAEIRDALTLKLLSTLQSPRVTTRFRQGLAYSPDGRSLAGCSDTGIIIWDTQTGGVVKEVDCGITGDGLELVWSLDGEVIATISPRVSEAITVHVYDVATGTKLPSGTFLSRGKSYLWAHDKSFRIAMAGQDRKGWTIDIFEVGPTLTKVESFPFRLNCPFEGFSPTTYRISLSTAGDRDHDPELLIWDIRNSEVMLQETGRYWHFNFSPDGSLFAAFTGDRLIVWMYASGCYTRRGEFRQTPTPLGFSPNSSSILACAGTLLQVLHLDHSPAAHPKESVVAAPSRPQDAFSPDCTYIATASCGESTVKITDLRSQNPSPSQFIDTDLEISAMVLTGNVLLVKGPDTVVAWLLTDEGVVDGIFGNTRADRNDSLWEISLRARWVRLLGRGGDGDDRHLEFSVEDGIAAIKLNGYVVRTYHTGTGETLKAVETPLRLRPTWYSFHNRQRDDCELYHRDLCKNRGLLDCDWPISQTTLREGWVKDPEGKHRLWLHARWRSAGNDVDWLHNATTLRLRNSSELVVVKF